MHRAEVTAVDVTVSEGGRRATVTLEARGECLPVFIIPTQAQALERARQDFPTERPVTHDPDQEPDW